MTEAEFEGYLETAIRIYAEEKVKAGNWSAEDALEKSERDFLLLLPQGVASEGQYLFSIRDAVTDETVGMIWFAVQERVRQPSAFIYDFSVDEAFQGRGYGKGALFALENEVRALGLSTVSLHVFGHNHTALTLYQRMGYETTNINMSKRLSD